MKNTMWGDVVREIEIPTVWGKETRMVCASNRADGTTDLCAVVNIHAKNGAQVTMFEYGKKTVFITTGSDRDDVINRFDAEHLISR